IISPFVLDRSLSFFFFFFQAEDGIRDKLVTGVQTCALPIYCTVTGLSGAGPDSLLVALYDRTDELRAQRDLIAREKLATVGEIASGVAHEVNNPLAAIRMEAELLGRASKDLDTSTTAATITREVDRAARIVR